MLIVEGPDGSGKTSLVEKLEKDLGLELIPKVVGGDAQSTGDVARWVSQSIDRGFGPYLYDRHALISEPIYGPAWKGEIRESFQNIGWLATHYAYFCDLRPLVIVCLPPIGEVVKNIRKDAQNDLLYAANPNDRHARIPKSVGQIYWQYFAALAREQTWVSYDYTIDDYETIKGLVRQILRARVHG